MRKNLTVLFSVALIALCLSYSQLSVSAARPAAPDAPGSLDPLFGNGGKVTTNLFIHANGYARAVAAQGDKILAAGQVVYNGESRFGVQRYSADGVLDYTFGDSGQATADFFSDADDKGIANAILVQPDGKILIAGQLGLYSPQVNDAFGVARFSADGILDSSFGVNGTVKINFDSNYDAAYALGLTSDNKIVVAGVTGSQSSSLMAVAQLLPNGALDSSFGSGGKVELVSEFGAGAEARALVVLPDGKILLGGHVGSTFGLVRINADGSLDTTFAGGGYDTTDFAEGSGIFNALALQSDGKIVAVGSIGLTYWALARYNSDGSLDTSFDGDGKVVTQPSQGDNAAYAVNILSSGKILVAGYASSVYNSTYNADFAVGRYNSNGSLDTTFGSNGVRLTDFTTNSSLDVDGRADIAYGLLVQSSGKIVLVGFSGNLFALARYTPAGALDTSFAGGGKEMVNGLTPAFDSVTAVAIQADNKIVAVGGSGGSDITFTSQSFSLARYNADGTLDSSFGAGGRVQTFFYSDANSASNAAAYAVKIQSDGKIVVTGAAIISAGSLYDLVTVRYNSDGSLDQSFGAGGIVNTDFDTNDRAHALVIQSDGKIVVGGTDGFEFVLARYNTNGSLDTSFDGDGKLTTSISDGSDATITALALSGDKIVAVGNDRVSGAGRNIVVVRYNADGSLDTSFDSDGEVITDLGGDDFASSSIVQPDGSIVVGGARNPAGTADYAVVRYTSDGALDTTFGVNGAVLISSSGPGAINGLALQSDGKILAAGFGDSAHPSDFYLLRLLSNGLLDSSFGSAGTLRTDFNDDDDVANAIALQADGKIVLAGYTAYTTGAADFALARYYFDNSPVITATLTPTSTATSVATHTPTNTVTATGTVTSAATATGTASSTATATKTATNTATATSTPTGTATSAPTSTATPCPITFSDVQNSDYFYTPVQYLYCRGVISGYNDNTFRPYNTTTRGQLAKIVVLGAGLPSYTPPNGTPTFNDVASDSPFFTVIESAAHAGVISGYSDHTFRPGANVTRGQLSKIIVAAKGWSLATPAQPTFQDVDQTNPFYSFIETAVAHGIISGYDLPNSEKEFRWQSSATRGQIAKIVYLAVTNN